MFPNASILSVEALSHVRGPTRLGIVLDQTEVYWSMVLFWRLRYRWAGKQNTLSCGVYPEIGLICARRRRDAARALLLLRDRPKSVSKGRVARLRDEQGPREGGDAFHAGQRWRAPPSALWQPQCVSDAFPETTELRAFLDATRSVPPRRSEMPLTDSG